MARYRRTIKIEKCKNPRNEPNKPNVEGASDSEVLQLVYQYVNSPYIINCIFFYPYLD